MTPGHRRVARRAGRRSGRSGRRSRRSGPGGPSCRPTSARRRPRPSTTRSRSACPSSRLWGTSRSSALVLIPGNLRCSSGSRCRSGARRVPALRSPSRLVAPGGAARLATSTSRRTSRSSPRSPRRLVVPALLRGGELDPARGPAHRPGRHLARSPRPDEGRSSRSSPRSSTTSASLSRPGENATAQLGLPDVLFFALFLGAADRFGLRVRPTWIAMHASFGADARARRRDRPAASRRCRSSRWRSCSRTRISSGADQTSVG